MIIFIISFFHTKIFIFEMLSHLCSKIKKVFPKLHLSLKSFYRSYCSVIPFKLTDIGEGIKEVEILKMHTIEGKAVKQFEKVINIHDFFQNYIDFLLRFFSLKIGCASTK